MFHRRLVFSLVTFTLLFVASQTSAVADPYVVNTNPSNTTIAQFGYPNTATYGQTITAVAGTTQLDSFSFNIAASNGTITYKVFVMQWDGSKAVGPVLFQSADQVTTGPGVTQYTYNTGGINLTPGTQYVLFTSVSLNYVPGNGSGYFTARNDESYVGGQFVYMNNGSNFGALSTNAWSFFSPAWDLAFTASFSTPAGAEPVPEPAGMFLLGTGLAGLAATIRKRRKTPPSP